MIKNYTDAIIMPCIGTALAERERTLSGLEARFDQFQQLAESLKAMAAAAQENVRAKHPAQQAN
jgi:hypothetical protein